MLLLLLLPALAAGFFVCKKSPLHYYRLHRYEGQMLYLQSASIGLVCSVIAYLLLAGVDYLFPPTLFGLNINLEAWLVALTLHATNLSEKDAYSLTWILMMTVATLFIAGLWVIWDVTRLKRLGKKHQVDANIIVMGKVLADSPLDALLYASYVSENMLVMLSLSNRKVYVGVVNNMGEPNEIEGFDQEISLVPVLSGYRDKDDLSIHWTTAYKDVDPGENLRIVIRQELIETASEFDFSIWEAFLANRQKARQ